MNFMSLTTVAVFFFATIAHAGEKLEIQGHRGARGSRPENTLPAFRFALESGVDTLELDMLVTKDDEVVVTHDPTLNPDICVDSRGIKIKSKIPIRSVPLKELKTFDCGALINPRFKKQVPAPATPIPTLDEVVQLAESMKKTVRFNIETKSDPEHPEYSPAPDKFVDLVLKVLRKRKVLDRVTLQSFDFRTLKVAREREPTLSLSMLFEERPKKPLADLALEYKAQILSPNFEWLTTEDVRAAHARKIRVIPWTVNDPDDWEKVINLGVDGIITDFPKELIEFVEKRQSPRS